MGPSHLATLYAIFLYAVDLVQSSLPSDLSQEVDKLMKKKSPLSVQIRVVDILDEICDVKNFKTYDFIPPKIVKACRYLIEQQDEDIEQAMVNHYRNNKDSLEKLEKFVCTHLSKACDGVTKDKKSKTKQKPRVVVDGEEKDDFDIKIEPDAKYVNPNREDKEEL